MFSDLFCKIKQELTAFKKYSGRTVLFGLLLVTFSLIVISGFSFPLWLGTNRMIPGGGLTVFVCYFASIIIFFLCGCCLSLLYSCSKSSFFQAKKAMTDIMISYVAMLGWLIVFFGVNQRVLSVVIITVSIVFMIFSVICTRKINVMITLTEAAISLVLISFLIFTVKFIVVN